MPIENISEKWTDLVRHICVTRPFFGNHLSFAKVDFSKSKEANKNKITRINLYYNNKNSYTHIVDEVKNKFFADLVKKQYGYFIPISVFENYANLKKNSNSVAQATNIAINKAQEELEEKAANSSIVKEIVKLFDAKILKVSRIE